MTPREFALGGYADAFALPHQVAELIGADDETVLRYMSPDLAPSAHRLESCGP